MRERVDCILLASEIDNNQSTSILEPGEYLSGRLTVRHLACNTNQQIDSAHNVLVSNAMVLRRFDAILISVDAANQGWFRRLLAISHEYLRTPVIALVSGLKATALNDLFGLGVVDVLRAPVCLEELRFRVHRSVMKAGAFITESGSVCQGYTSSRTMNSSAAGLALSEPGQPSAAGAELTESQLCENILQRSGSELEAFAIAMASRQATSKHSFRAAKGKVIERFEKAYINAALGRHGGNIAMAARSAQKHRRAFWALMRKYNIDAGPYRANSGLNPSPDG